MPRQGTNRVRVVDSKVRNSKAQGGISMFDPKTAGSTLAPYQPRPAEAQRMDDFSFRFGEGESLKGVWSVVRKRKIGIMMAGCLGLGLALAACMVQNRQYQATST